jgi:hypothetical protein
MHAITLSVGETQQVTATPLDGQQQPIPDAPATTFTSEDSSRVAVSADGTVSAKSTTNGPLRVFASLQYAGTTRKDTVFVQVTAAAPTVDALTIAPTDSAKLGATSSATVPHTVTAVGGDTIRNVPVYYWSENPQRATVNSTTGSVKGMSPGKVKIYASATVYGVALVDSTELTITNPVSASPYYYNNKWSLSSILLEPGGIIDFTNYSPNPIDVVFSDPSKAEAVNPGDPSGNIALFTSASNPARRFTVPGTYTFHTDQGPGTVRVIVQAANVGD